MYSDKRKNRGMTLVETLVVISILGIFMTIAVPSVVKAFKVISQVKQLTIRYPSARKALLRMSDKIRRTYPSALKSGAAFVGKSSSIEAEGLEIRLPYDELSFPVLDTGYSHVRSTHEISYRLDLEPAEGKVLRGLVEKRTFIGAIEAAGTEEIVWDRIVGLDFRYLNESAEPAEWVEEWPPPSAIKADAVPAAVRITIFVLGDISPEPRTFTTVVNIPSK